MKVRFYGVRGSVPTPGPTTVRYGGNTVCVDVRLADGTALVLDAGTGLRELGNTLQREGHRGTIHLLLSHLHWDHVLGIPFFKPIYRNDTHLRIHPLGNEPQQDAIRCRTIFDGIHFPVRAADLPAQIDLVEEAQESWRIGSAQIRRIALNHPGGAQGFRIDDDDGSSLCYLTDNELSPPGVPVSTLDALARFSAGVDLLIHDAQYLESDMPAKRGWGHSTVDDVLRLGHLAEARQLLLFHHDPERDDDALDRLGHAASDWLRAAGSSTRASVAREAWSFTLGADEDLTPLSLRAPT
jgi:phosphoribosyl 1,2-cyclic phosphodiesterase